MLLFESILVWTGPGENISKLYLIFPMIRLKTISVRSPSTVSSGNTPRFIRISHSFSVKLKLLDLLILEGDL